MHELRHTTHFLDATVSLPQNDIKRTGAHWQTQWTKSARKAKLIVCIMCESYFSSGPCLEEFGVAKNGNKLLVVYKVGGTP